MSCVYASCAVGCQCLLFEWNCLPTFSILFLTLKCGNRYTQRCGHHRLASRLIASVVPSRPSSISNLLLMPVSFVLTQTHARIRIHKRESCGWSVNRCANAARGCLEVTKHMHIRTHVFTYAHIATRSSGRAQTRTLTQ